VREREWLTVTANHPSIATPNSSTTVIVIGNTGSVLSVGPAAGGSGSCWRVRDGCSRDGCNPTGVLAGELVG
jgi:hypothetical protein